MDENTTSANTDAAKNSNTTMFVIGAIVLAAILGYVVMSSANDDETPPAELPAETAVENDTVQEIPPYEIDTATESIPEAEESDVNVKTFDLQAANFRYTPNTITVKRGDTVRINLTSNDLMHDFNIDSLGVKMPVTNSGETNTVEFVANEAGEFEFYCSVGQHRANGQVGTLIVTEE